MKRMKHINLGTDAALMHRFLLLKVPFTRATLPVEPPNFDGFFSDPRTVRGYEELDKQWYLIDAPVESKSVDMSDSENGNSSMDTGEYEDEDNKMTSVVDLFFGGTDTTATQPGSSAAAAVKASERVEATQGSTQERKYPKRLASIFPKNAFKQ